MAGLRLVLGVEVEVGDQSQSNTSLPGLTELLDRMLPEKRPKCVRGYCGFGNVAAMLALEQRGISYLFKLKLTKNVKRYFSKYSGVMDGKMRVKVGKVEKVKSSSAAGISRGASAHYAARWWMMCCWQMRCSNSL